MFDFKKQYFETIENNISKLPNEEREKVYCDCGQNCAKYGVLNEYKKLYEKCEGDLDKLYSSMHELGDVEGKIIKSNSEYEIIFPRCLCPLYEEGYLKNPSHCECSRQSIIYVLHELCPERNIKVEMIGTVLSGDKNCRFKISFLD